MRYEVTRRFAPYVGVERERAFGRTADLRRGDGEGVDDTRVVAGRMFALRDGVWTDLAASSDARTLRIRPFSEAYFELLRLLPELEPIVRELDTVSVGGGRLTLAFVDDGGARLSGDRTALVRDFRAVR